MVGSVLLIGWLLGGQAADDAGLRTEVRKLVKQLDASQLAQREAAEARLLKLGPEVLELLPRPDADISPEVKERLRRIRQRLQQTVVDSAAQASTVTLHGRMPLAKIMAAFGQQTGNQVLDARRKPDGAAADPELAVDFDQKPFWSALDTVADQAGLAVYPFARPDAVQLVARGAGQLPRGGFAALSGPFRIEATRIVAQRDLRQAGSPSLKLGLEVAWEPRIRLIGLKCRMADVKAIDDRGEPLPTQDAEAVMEAFPRRDAAAVELDLGFTLAAYRPKEIASLKGTLRAIVPGKVETFRFSNLLDAKRAEQRIAAATVTLDRVRKNGDRWEVSMRLRLDDAGDSLESHRNWVLLNETYLEGPEGKPILPDSSEITQRGQNEIGMSYAFQLDQPPDRLTFVYKTPGSIVTKDFPYELKGLFLP